MPFKAWSSGVCILQAAERVLILSITFEVLLMVSIDDILQMKLQPSEMLPVPATCFSWLLTVPVPKLGWQVGMCIHILVTSV